jgi:hypothetical protein
MYNSTSKILHDNLLHHQQGAVPGTRPIIPGTRLVVACTRLVVECRQPVVASTQPVVVGTDHELTVIINLVQLG